MVENHRKIEENHPEITEKRQKCIFAESQGIKANFCNKTSEKLQEKH